jgi:hypothetical protein
VLESDTPAIRVGASDGSHVVITAASVMMKNDTANQIVMESATPSVRVGASTAAHAYITSGSFAIKNGTANQIVMEGVTPSVRIGASDNSHLLATAASLCFKYGTANRVVIENDTPAIRIGASTTSHVYITDSIVALKYGTTNKILLDGATGSAWFDGVVALGAASGGIFQGTGTFSAPTTALKIWNDSGVGRIAGYNGGASQAGFGTDGKFYAGAGAISMDATNLLLTSAGDATTCSKWVNTETSSCPSAFGFVNLQKTDPNGALKGVLNVGERQSATNDQSGISAYENAVDVIIQKAGTYTTPMSVSSSVIHAGSYLAFWDGTTGTYSTGMITLGVEGTGTSASLKAIFEDGTKKTIAAI